MARRMIVGWEFDVTEAVETKLLSTFTPRKGVALSFEILSEVRFLGRTDAGGFTPWSRLYKLSTGERIITIVEVHVFRSCTPRRLNIDYQVGNQQRWTRIVLKV